MKKRILYIIAVLLCTFTFTTVKANVIENCKVSEAFERYMNLSEEEQKKQIPPPYCESKGLAEYENINQEEEITKDKDGFITSIGGVPTKAASYPSYYRSSTTAVKNQKLTGTCWAFASTTILESFILRKYDISLTFSPQHLNYMESQSFYDISSNPYGANRGVNLGGWTLDSEVYYMNHYGPVYESTVPTNTSVETLPNISSANIIGQKNVLDVRETESFARSTPGGCTTAEKERIKYLIYNYGPTTASMNYLSEYVTSTGGYMYQSSSLESNHTVSIIGWDDNYAVSNFSGSYARPQRPGAWIIQNSHGTDSGLNGFFYVSYEDSMICSVIFGIRDADGSSEDNRYTEAQTPARSSANTTASMVVYQKQKSHDELLSKISFKTNGPTSYSVYYYPGNAATNNIPVSKMKLIGSGRTDFMGWVTVDSTNSVVIPTSIREYSVVVVQNSGVVPVMPSYFQYKQNGQIITVSSKETFKSGSSFIMQNGKWVDLYNYCNENYKVPINAFTYNLFSKIDSASVSYTYQDYFNVTVKVSAQGSGKISSVKLTKNGRTYASLSPSKSVSAGNVYTFVLKKSGLSGFVNGTYQVQVEQDNGVYNSYNLPINVLPITSVEIKNTTNKVYIGKTLNMKVQAYPSGHNSTNPTITWKSSNTSIATVSSTGVVTGKALGKATITARTTNGYTDSYEIVVVKPITGLSLNTSSIDMVVGGTRTILATVLPTDTTDSKTLRWESSDPKVATVDSKGVVKALKPGRTTIRVVTVNGIPKTVAVTVYGVLLNKTNATLEVNKTVQLTANVINNNKSKTATWSSSNTKVATVNSSGLVTAKGEGNATITARDYAGRGASATIKVTKISASKFTVTEISVKTYNGKEQKPAPEVKYNGKVLKAGTDYTVVYSNNKKPGKATVTIKANPNSKIYGGAKTVYFIIKPKGTTLQKLTTKSKTVRVYWAKHPYITDYHIQYRVKGSSTWKNLYVSGPADSPGYYHDITGLTKGKYYQVRVRAQKKVDKKDYYGAYSTIKTIKCK